MEKEKKVKKEKKKKERKKLSPKQKKIILVSAIIIIIVALSIKPILTGYSTLSLEKEYQQQIEGLNNELSLAKANLEESEEDYEILLEEKDKLSGDKENLNKELTSAKEKVSSAEEEVESLNNKIKSLNDDMNQLKIESAEEEEDLRITFSEQIAELSEENLAMESDLTSLQSDYDDFARKIANSVCCKQKIDNPSINFYSVREDLTLACLTSGENELSCPW